MSNQMITKAKNFWNEDIINRAVVIVVGAFIVVSITFAGYYYWDRYIHIGDQSPLEMGVEHLQEMVRENPEDPEVRLALAQYYFDNGAFEKAIEQSQQVAQAFPENDAALFIIGLSYLRSGKMEAAIEPLESFAAMRRESPNAKMDNILETALYFLGESYVKMGNYQAAISVLEEALQISFSDADAMFQLGLAYALSGQHALAVDQFNNAVRFVPDFSEAYHAMAASYAELGQHGYVAYASGMEALSNNEIEEAQNQLEEAAQALPDYPPVFLGLGLVYEQQKDYETAVINLEKALKYDPYNFMAQNTLGRIQLLMEQKTDS